MRWAGYVAGAWGWELTLLSAYLRRVEQLADLSLDRREIQY
jgi:hypothetical protein